MPVIHIGDGAFQQNRLTSVTISNSVTSIGNEAFRDNRLRSARVSKNVTSIGDGVFRNNNPKSFNVTIYDRVTQPDVYVAEEERYRATLWKNGVEQSLSTSSSSSANSVFVGEN